MLRLFIFYFILMEGRWNLLIFMTFHYQIMIEIPFVKLFSHNFFFHLLEEENKIKHKIYLIVVILIEINNKNIQLKNFPTITHKTIITKKQQKSFFMTCKIIFSIPTTICYYLTNKKSIFSSSVVIKS